MSESSTKQKKVPELRFSQFSDSWQEKRIAQILTVCSGRDYKHLKAGNVPVFGTGGVMTYVDEALHDGESVFIGRKGTIDKPVYFSGRFWTVDTLFYTSDFKEVTPKFVYRLFQNIYWKKYNEASGVPSLSRSTIGKIKVFLPSVGEQKKIQVFLNNADSLIEKMKYQREKLEEFKQGVMLKIFTQEVRFKDKNGKNFPDWQTVRLGKIIEERTERAGNKNYDLLSITMKNGVTKYDDSVKKNNSSGNKSNYKVVRKNDIAYNTMRMWQGASGVSAFEGIVSPAYTVVAPKTGDPNFFGYLFKIPRVVFDFYRYSQGLTSDTWNLKFKHLKEIKVTVPTSKDEQLEISNFLKSVDELIEFKSKQIEKAETWKRGLLQKMFV
ncbi:MAG: restriction endonuclease subunit S [Candidatus Nomurabacteria bacterium]|nr:MAG: restriction endonuclease subunit S [Candidatus Nomurabacteria bacterium]